jgi:hypothetical protein
MTANNEIVTMTPDEFAARFAPAATPDSHFIRNRETGKLELHFDKADYDALTDAQKQSIKGAFLWGRRSGCWISRCKEPNLWRAEQVAKALGLADAGTTGERLSFAEQQERKTAKAERRAERFENAADRAAARGEALQKPVNDMHGDIAFFTQPNVNSSAGRAFTRQRERMFNAFEAGFKEFNKSAYYRERAATARDTAAQKGLQDKGFIARRIAECESSLRKLKKNVEQYEATKQRIEQGTPVKRFDGEPLALETVNAWIEDMLDRMEAELDKLGYYQDTLDALGGVTYSQDNIRPGFVVKLRRWGDCTVVSTGPKNITFRTRVDAVPLTAAYAEIENIVSAAEKADEPHPFKVGDTFTCSRWNREKGGVDKLEFRIIRATDKSVTIQTGDEKPFVRKPSQVTWDNSGKWRLCVTDWNDGTVYKLPDR